MIDAPALLQLAAPPGLPRPRGPRSAHVVGALTQGPHEIAPLPEAVDGPLDGDDNALALYLMYELHYRGFRGVDERWEWEPSLLRERARLEAEFEAALLAVVPPTTVAPGDVTDALEAIAAADGPSLSAYMEHEGTLEQMREFAMHRSAYQLKEADPHTWVVPRLSGRTKAAVVEIQAGEYGDGDPQRIHSSMFADTMLALELDHTYGAYLDRLPGVTLASVNLMSLFGLHRRWRGAVIGHLALFEMCSVVPMRRYSTALHRLGAPAAAPFYDAHVVADAHHEVVALHDMAAGLAVEEPQLASDIVFGARALDTVEATFARTLLRAWSEGRTSLRTD